MTISWQHNTWPVKKKDGLLSPCAAARLLLLGLAMERKAEAARKTPKNVVAEG